MAIKGYNEGSDPEVGSARNSLRSTLYVSCLIKGRSISSTNFGLDMLINLRSI